MEKLTHIINNNSFHNTEILSHLASANRHLGELKGLVTAMPNQAIIINTLGLQESQDSSEIENIITTQDELFTYSLHTQPQNVAAKEVTNYSTALRFLFEKLANKEMITTNMLIEAQAIIVGNDAGIRQGAGTILANAQTGEVVYTPPSPDAIIPLLTDLEQFINNKEQYTELDPLIKMALIHHQFESIHPFLDGNGRIGRILNIMYLIHAGVLDTPILYLSRYINHNKQQYYTLLQSVREENNWQAWVIYLLQGIAKTAQSTNALVSKIMTLLQTYKHTIRNEHAKIYSQELLNNIFKHPYTKIAFLQKDLGVSRPTAGRYLDQLVEGKLLTKIKLGKEHYYVNDPLVALLAQQDDLSNNG